MTALPHQSSPLIGRTITHQGQRAEILRILGRWSKGIIANLYLLDSEEVARHVLVEVVEQRKVRVA